MNSHFPLGFSALHWASCWWNYLNSTLIILGRDFSEATHHSKKPHELRGAGELWEDLLCCPGASCALEPAAIHVLSQPQERAASSFCLPCSVPALPHCDSVTGMVKLSCLLPSSHWGVTGPEQVQGVPGTPGDVSELPGGLRWDPSLRNISSVWAVQQLRLDKSHALEMQIAGGEWALEVPVFSRFKSKSPLRILASSFQNAVEACSLSLPCASGVTCKLNM